MYSLSSAEDVKGKALSMLAEETATAGRVDVSTDIWIVRVCVHTRFAGG